MLDGLKSFSWVYDLLHTKRCSKQDTQVLEFAIAYAFLWWQVEAASMSHSRKSRYELMMAHHTFVPSYQDFMYCFSIPILIMVHFKIIFNTCNFFQVFINLCWDGQRFQFLAWHEIKLRCTFFKVKTFCKGKSEMEKRSKTSESPNIICEVQRFNGMTLLIWVSSEQMPTW